MSACQLDRVLDESLKDRVSRHLFRCRRILETPQGAEVRVDGRQCIAFCSNDYLGLANHPEVVRAFQQAANNYGLGGGASHLILGHSKPHHQLEEELAEFTRRPRTLLFSTGYMANLGVISALLGVRDSVFEDRLNHASLLDAGQLSGARMQRYRHSDLDDLGRRLAKTNHGKKLIVTDGVFSMDGDQARLPELANLARRHDAWLMVDDAHGFGCIGCGGRGSADDFQLTMTELPVLVGTLGKAFGTFGAFVAGSDSLIEALVQYARSYIYTTAMPPAIAEATRVSLRILEQEQWRRDHLGELIACFRNGCATLGVPLMASTTPIQPIMVGDIQKTLNISEALLREGILVTPIRPPTVPKGGARLRVTFSANHQIGHVHRLLDALERVTRQVKLAVA